MNFTNLLLAAALAVVSAPAAAQAAKGHKHAHVHGAARLNVAIQEQAVTIELESPLDSFVGFERRPRTPAETAALDALQARMRAPEGLFVFDTAAGCTLTKSAVESALFKPAAPGAKVSEHADIDARFEYRCTSPDKLTTLDVGLFEAYPKLARLQIEVASPKGQFKRDLRRPARTVALVRR